MDCRLATAVGNKLVVAQRYLFDAYRLINKEGGKARKNPEKGKGNRRLYTRRVCVFVGTVGTRFKINTTAVGSEKSSCSVGSNMAAAALPVTFTKVGSTVTFGRLSLSLLRSPATQNSKLSISRRPFDLCVSQHTNNLLPFFF